MRDGGPFPMEREGAFPLRRRTARDRHQVPAGGPDPRPRHPAADEVRAPPYPPPQPGRDGGGDGSRSSRPKEVRPGVRSPVRAASWRCRRSHSRRPSRRCTEGTSWRRSTTTPRSSPPFDQRGEGRGERRSVGGGWTPPFGCGHGRPGVLCSEASTFGSAYLPDPGVGAGYLCWHLFTLYRKREAAGDGDEGDDVLFSVNCF